LFYDLIVKLLINKLRINELKNGRRSVFSYLVLYVIPAKAEILLFFTQDPRLRGDDIEKIPNKSKINAKKINKINQKND
jgi:hypothetical protein